MRYLFYILIILSGCSEQKKEKVYFDEKEINEIKELYYKFNFNIVQETRTLKEIELGNYTISLRQLVEKESNFSETYRIYTYIFLNPPGIVDKQILERGVKEDMLSIVKNRHYLMLIRDYYKLINIIFSKSGDGSWKHGKKIN